jgi:hypothetical protein
MKTLKEQVEEIYNNIAESQWEIMWGKSIEETAREIIEKCIQNN